MRGFHREFLKSAAQLGFVFDGYSGCNHIRLINRETGQQASAALTPSNRGLRNDLAKLERLSGRQLPHRQAGKYKYRKQSQLDTRLSPAERQASEQVATLLGQADSVRRRIEYLKTQRTRAAATEMRSALIKFGHLRNQLEQLHHHLSPIEGAH